jgi:hypothetical protein
MPRSVAQVADSADGFDTSTTCDIEVRVSTRSYGYAKTLPEATNESYVRVPVEYVRLVFERRAHEALRWRLYYLSPTTIGP